MRIVPYLFLLALLALGGAAQAQEPAIYDYRIVQTYPHDPAAYTQGLFYLDGRLYESTGIVGQSTIRIVRFEDGQVLRRVDIPAGHFGEGIVNWGRQIVSITWLNGIGWRWDLASLRREAEWRYPGEGWGLTQDGVNIIMSDGTAELRFLDPATLIERRRVGVTLRGQPLTNLNELEWVNGEVFANIYLTGIIARIDPASGQVTGLIDLRVLARENGSDGDHVLNGIAWDAAGDRLFVTGKLWPHLYEIDLIPRPAS